ncbi:MAG: pyrimidine 5'-nucleotidase [Betaproteobacteria bacterium]|nr:pyrimidine 5'-nucleotidase [Betaproteobacteria bacterium]
MLTWIFDLDNTLHDARPHIFPHLSRSMTAYLREHLVLDEAAASALRVHYWRTYGATLLGLMRHHGTDPQHFLLHTHQFSDLARMVVAEGGLRQALKRLRGRKILFSNAPQHYVRAVLEILRITGQFDALYSVEHMRYQPKPLVGGFRLLLARERLSPERSVLVEDSLANLRAARRLGMKTVWVTRETRSPAWLDAKVASVLALPRLASTLGQGQAAKPASGQSR